MSTCITNIQECEKEKLLLTAAKHMDVLRQNYPGLGSHFGPSTGEPEYVIAKIRELHVKIAEALEEIQALKCDL
jgi:hypothetical protein